MTHIQNFKKNYNPDTNPNVTQLYTFVWLRHLVRRPGDIIVMSKKMCKCSCFYDSVNDGTPHDNLLKHLLLRYINLINYSIAFDIRAFGIQFLLLPLAFD